MIICGLDECGRGPLAGPIVAAAVILHKPIRGLNDSKQLKMEQRQRLFGKIIKNSHYCVEMISVRQINSRGIGWANKVLFKRLSQKLKADKYIADGNLRLGKKIQSVVKADTKIQEVMAASIVAKVTRDKLMRALHEEFPNYGWQSNMGYGTKFHIASLKKHGPSIHHRKLFIRNALSVV